MKTIAFFLLALCATAGAAASAGAQETPAQPTPTADAEAAKGAAEKQAYALLEDVIAGAQGLRLPENRGRMQVAAADLLWARDEGRARALFTEAAAGLTDLLRQVDTSDRQAFAQARSVMQFRQELVLAAARHDATLAYQLFQTTRRPPTSEDQRMLVRDSDDALEQRLLAQIAASDPLVALSKAQEMLDKGQYSPTLAAVLARLQAQDKTAAAKLSDKLIAQLQTDNLLANRDADGLALSLLQPGPRPTATPAAADAAPARNAQALNEAAYRTLLDTVITAALRATPAANTEAQRNVVGSIRAAPQGGGRGGGGRGGPAAVAQPQQTNAQVEQGNAHRLLTSLQMLLPQIDQYLPGRAQAVRQKLTELGVSNNQRAAFTQFGNLVQQGTSDNLLTAAATAPPQLQTRLYQQAAFRALDEGNVERARQIASDHLDADARGVVQQAIEAQQTLRKAKANQLEDVRQMLARLPSDDERVRLLLQLADAAQADNPKQALQFLEEARTLVARRATSYQQLENQLQVAHAFAALDPARSFEVLEPGIGQLNELLPAAAMLSGFEVNIFRDGEMSITGNSGLGAMVQRYGQELATLAKSDFERARTTADHFQYPEARLMARLAIVQGILGVRSNVPLNNRFNRRGFAQGGPLGRQQ
ncbi:MAG TPA: hypothetical protein VF525_12765 [Pyrinomonadaceae bacterium]|jgi:hypothetical protein